MQGPGAGVATGWNLWNLASIWLLKNLEYM
jgi:hypothetical protein